MLGFHAYEEAGLELVDHANFSTTNSVEIRCTAQQLTDALSGVDIWKEFVPQIRSVDWEGDPPFTEGVRRTVGFGKDIVKEVFFKWDENEGVAFRVTEGTQKNVAAMIEHYQFDIVDDNTTRLTWSLAMKMTGLRGLIAPLMARLAGKAMAGWLVKLKHMVEVDIGTGGGPA